MADIDDTILVAYVDGELDAATAREVEQKLRNNPAAQHQVRLLRQTAALVRAAVNEPAHGQVPRKLVQTLEPPRSMWRRRLQLRPWLVWSGSAAVLLVTLAMGFIAGTTELGRTLTGRHSDFLSEIAEYHTFYALDSDHPAEISADDVADLEARIGRQLNRTVTVPDLSARGLSFQGGRLLLVDDRPVAQLVYESARLRPLAICIAFAEEQLGTDVRVTAIDRLNLLSWQKDGYAYVIVGWATEDFLRALHAETAATLERL